MSQRRRRESTPLPISDETRATAEAWCREWDALTDEERERRNEELARSIREASE